MSWDCWGWWRRRRRRRRRRGQRHRQRWQREIQWNILPHTKSTAALFRVTPCARARPFATTATLHKAYFLNTKHVFRVVWLCSNYAYICQQCCESFSCYYLSVNKREWSSQRKAQIHTQTQTSWIIRENLRHTAYHGLTCARAYVCLLCNILWIIVLHIRIDASIFTTK